MYIIITMSINPNPLPSSISSSLNQLKLGNLPQLKMSKTAKTTILTQQIIEFIVNEVKVIPNFQTMSTDLHLMHHICNVIENLERKDLEPKLDKKALFLDIVKQLFTDLNTNQLSFLDNFADFICASNLIAKVTTMQKVHQLVKKKLAPI
jgi:hypothetical protein